MVGFVTLGTQNAVRMRYIVICGLSGCAVLLHIISQKAKFLKNIVLNVKCVFWYSLQLLFETFLILIRTERDMKEIYIDEIKWNVSLMQLNI